jgi:peptidyl-prolyl cis-trans isomerase B (cyclophilin B)
MRKRLMVMFGMLVFCGGIGTGWTAEEKKAEEKKAEEKKATVEKKAGEEKKMEPHAIIKTKFGEMEIKFFSEVAPKHVENFTTLAKSGFYNGTIFHRVIPGFMIQGGDPNTKDPNRVREYGQGGPPGVRLKAEFNDKPHKRGIVSMARSNDPNSAGSQFFIVVKDSNFLDRQYTAFGEVIRGMEVADQIVNAPRGPADLPNERVEMTIAIVEKPGA